MKIKLNGKSDPTLPNYLSPERLKAEPLRIPKGEPHTEILARLERVKSYNQYQVSLNQPQHITTRRDVMVMLAKGGYDHKLADKHGVGMTPEEMAEAFPKEEKKPSVD